MQRAYSSVPGFFIQDQPLAAAAEIGALPPRFGLLDDSAARWSNFRHKIRELNSSAPKGTVYKVFFLGRHGQGYHNVAEAKYGTQAWHDYWSKLTGDNEMVWGPDALLTPTGEDQAREARQAWEKEIPYDIPVPHCHYASPLKRALDTWKLTFAQEGEEQVLAAEHRKVTILENCREEYGEHTCDKRSTLSHLLTIYPLPTYTFEAGFPELDPVWLPDERESKAHVAERALSALDVAFVAQEEYISIVAHSGFINGFLAAVGRPSYPLPTGGILPIVIKRENHLV